MPGSHWKSVSPGVAHTFSNVGTDLRWRAVMSCSNNLYTPSISSIQISHNAKVRNAPSLSWPADQTITQDTTPNIQWTAVSSTTDYYIEFDTTSTFASGDKRTYTPGNVLTYNLPSALTNDVWYWRVAGRDAEGDIGEFSSYRRIIIDTTYPTIDSPTNYSYSEGETDKYLTWTPSDINPKECISQYDFGI